VHDGGDINATVFDGVDQPIGETGQKVSPETAFDSAPEKGMAGYFGYAGLYRIKKGLAQSRLAILIEGSRLARFLHGFGVEDHRHEPRPFRICLSALAARMALRCPLR
jgi:hypothetical protein